LRTDAGLSHHGKPHGGITGHTETAGLDMRHIGLVTAFCLILLGGCDEPGGLGPSTAQAAGGAISFPGVPQPKTPAQIVGMVIDNDTGRSMPARVVRLGQAFVPGQLTSGTDVVATGPDGAVPTQLDVKASNPDGSVRFAVVSVAIRPLSGGSSLPLMLTHGSAPSAAAAPPAVPVSRLVADTVTVDIAMHGGATHHVEAGPAMAQAIAAGKASLWREGPVVTEARVDVPVEGSLHVVFDIAAEATGGVSTDVEICNDYVMRPVGGTAEYDVTIAQGGKPVLHQDNIRQFQYTTWHTVVRSDGAGEPHIVHDPAYLLRTGALLSYDLRAGVDGSVLATEMRQMEGPGFGILGNAGLAMYMGATGGRPDIGPTTTANAAWVITQDRRAEAYALAQADAAGSIPWHYDDVAHGRALNLDDYPTVWSDPRGLTIGAKVGLPQPVYPFNATGGQIDLFTKCNCFSLDAAHQPDLSFVPYLMTSSRYYLDQLVYQAAWNATGATPGVRQDAKGLVVTIGVGQVRGHAWSLRAFDNAAYIVPDNHPLKRYFVRLRDNNYAYVESRIPELTRQEGEAYGYDATLGKDGTIAPWQEEYLALVIGQAATQGYEPAQRVMRWMTHYLATRFLVASSGFDPHDAVAYQMRVAPSENATPEQFFKTWTEIAAGNEALGYATHGQWTKWTFPASQQAALASLATAINVTDDAQAKQAYAWLRANGPKEDFARRSPQFSIAPQR